MTSTYRITRVLYDSEDLDIYLGQGWEPFSVVNGAGNETWVYLRILSIY
jgi:hypothetical protein